MVSRPANGLPFGDKRAKGKHLKALISIQVRLNQGHIIFFSVQPAQAGCPGVNRLSKRLCVQSLRAFLLPENHVGDLSCRCCPLAGAECYMQRRAWKVCGETTLNPTVSKKKQASPLFHYVGDTSTWPRPRKAAMQPCTFNHSAKCRLRKVTNQ